MTADATDGGTWSRVRAVAGRVALALASRSLPRHYLTPTHHYLREKALKDVTSAIFIAGDRVGVHVLPKHFYTPVADYRWLREHRRDWDGPASMAGVRWDLDHQLAWLAGVCEPHLGDSPTADRIAELERARFGPGFDPIDGQVLHCVIRAVRPSRVVEVGSGVSTALMRAALARNECEGSPPARLTAIDPYARDRVRSLDGVEMIGERAESVPMSTFEGLGAGDLLFIDSSHAVRVGSEVVRLVLEVLPRLAEGVVVHVHDVTLPYLYPRAALSDYFGWQETTLLLALMSGNPRLEPLACMSGLHYGRTRELMALLPDYRPQANDQGLRAGDWAGRHFPSSLYLRVT